tara:strand:- start:3615 stop:5000 length:1386 start_codon:yes stop_codon:yes gene_type:complete
MEHGIELTGLAVVAAAATLCGMAMARLNQPAIVGYILAGVILGPSGLALVGDRGQIEALAELGVLMLLYIIGMELSVRSFRHMWRIAVFSAGLQILVSLIAVLFLGYALGWPMPHVLLFAFVLALSSTAVGVTMMEDVGALRQRVGRIAVGVLIAQDLAVAPMLIILTGLSGDGFDFFIALGICLTVGLLILLIRYLSRRQSFNLPFSNLVLGKVDLRPVAALAWCFAAAALAGLVGISAVFGAFLAGLVVGSSQQRHEFFAAAKPIESILLMTFFLSIGLLIDLQFLWDNLGLVLLLWAFVTIFKTALNTAIFRAMGESWQHAFLSSLFLAQIGEFGFILGGVAIDSSIIDSDLYRLVVAVTVLSLITSPIWMNSARRVQHRAARRMDTIGGLLRLVYFREWRFTRRNSRALYDAAIWIVTRIEIWVERLRRYIREQIKNRRKTQDTPPDEDQMPGPGDA